MAAHPLNLKVLQRHDPSISSIIDSATYVVLYHYQDDSWKKEGIEGSMFIYRRSSSPPLGLIILNRYGPNNFVRPITKNTEFDIQGKVLMINEQGTEGADAKVSGIWVHDAAEGKKLMDLMSSLRDAECTSVPLPPTAQPTLAPPPSNGSLSFSEILNRLTSPSITPASPEPIASQSPVLASRAPQGLPSSPYQHHPTASPLRFQSAPNQAFPLSAPASPVRAGNGTNLKGNDLLQALFASASNSPQSTPTFSPARVHPQPQLQPQASSVHPMYAPNNVYQTHQPPYPAYANPNVNGYAHSAPVDTHSIQADIALEFVGRDRQLVDRSTGGIEGYGNGKCQTPLGKKEFVGHLLELINMDPSFVDSLYTKYLAASVSSGRSEGGAGLRGHRGVGGVGADVG